MAHLLVTIDVECDKGPRWYTASPLSFRGVTEAIPALLQPLFARFGVRPSYLLSPEVLADDACVKTLRSLKDAELGAHLHGEYIGPEPQTTSLPGSITLAMQRDYPPEIERAKLAMLTALFRERLGYSPTAFRAGRFGIGHGSGRWLAELGYLVDSSVVPHEFFATPSGKSLVDFRACPERPYWAGHDCDLFSAGTSPLLEVPVTVLADGVLPSARPLWPNAQPGGPTWFRPWYSDEETLGEIVRRVAAEPQPRPLVMMFHNVELVADASPYTRSASDVRRYLELLAVAFTTARAAGFVPLTLSEYAAEFGQRPPGSF
jgi:hypothetical protein